MYREKFKVSTSIRQIYHGTGWLTIRKTSTATIYDLKNGKVTNIRFSTMEKTADALNIS